VEAHCFRYFALSDCCRHLEACGSSLFSLFCTVRLLSPFGSMWKLTVFAILHCQTVVAIWKHVEAHCFRYYALQTVVTIWKHVEAHCFRYFALSDCCRHMEACGSSLFSLFCTALTLRRQNSDTRNSQSALRFFQNSEISSVISLTLS
jgi:hypothetical protein